MPIEIVLEPDARHCSMVPLAVLGYCLTRSQFLAPIWEPLDPVMQTRDHTPVEKLQDVLVSILAGCRSLQAMDVRLRPEGALARAWGRKRFVHSSTASRTLDALTEAHLTQLRAGSLQLFQSHTQLRDHDWSQWLLLDFDPTSLLASKRAEGSTRGWFSGKKTAMDAMCCASPSRPTMRV